MQLSPASVEGTVSNSEGYLFNRKGELRLTGTTEQDTQKPALQVRRIAVAARHGVLAYASPSGKKTLGCATKLLCGSTRNKIRCCHRGNCGSHLGSACSHCKA